MTSPPHRSLHLVVVLLVTAASSPQVGAAASPPAPDRSSQAESFEKLGQYEKRTVRQVLRERGWTIDPDPAGKTIRRVRIVTLPVFSERDPQTLQWFNRFHATTHPAVIRREVLLESGESWKREDAEETERNLRDPVFTSLAVVLPIETSEPERVDLLVIVRDIWSLRANATFDYQNGLLSELYVSVSENNLLGRHKSVSAIFDMRQGSYGLGPQYYDPNVFGSHVEFLSTANVIFNRHSGAFEGTRSETVLRYPLWNLDRTWGAEASVTHSDEIIREFRGRRLLEYDDPDTAETEEIPYEYRVRRFGAEGLVRYAVGEAVRNEFSLGYRFETQQPELLPAFALSPRLRSSYRADVMPPSERNSGPFLGYFVFVPEWVTYRNIDSYDLPEEEPVGPYLELEVAPFLESFGSLRSFLRGAATAGWLVDIAQEGYVWFEGGSIARFWEGRLFDKELYGLFHVATPDAWRAARLVGRLRLDLFVDDTQNRLLFAGGKTGLRGYPIGAFSGVRSAIGNLEVRTFPADLGSIQMGAVAFWDVGHASDRLGNLRARHDVGAGLRILVPQVNTIPMRVDWAFPVGSRQPVWPGRLSIGFGQVF